MAASILRTIRTAVVGPATQADRPTRLPDVLRIGALRGVSVLEPTARLPSVPPVYHVYAVYRRRNAGTLGTLLAGISGLASLWALDDVADELAHLTVGDGPGSRFANLNRAAGGKPPADDDWVVLADDDVAFDRGSLDQAVAMARRCGFDLAQVSHSRRSYLNWTMELHRPFSLARLCRYVDQGPLLILSPRGAEHLLPLPEDCGMGWGIETLWAADSHLCIGTVDAATVRHLTPVSWIGNYDVRAEIRDAERRLQEAGYANWEQVQRELGRWWVWQANCPWS